MARGRTCTSSGGVCTVTSVARAEAQCVATYALPGGQITGQAILTFHLQD